MAIQIKICLEDLFWGMSELAWAKTPSERGQSFFLAHIGSQWLSNLNSCALLEQLPSFVALVEFELHYP